MGHHRLEDEGSTPQPLLAGVRAEGVPSGCRIDTAGLRELRLAAAAFHHRLVTLSPLPYRLHWDATPYQCGPRSWSGPNGVIPPSPLHMPSPDPRDSPTSDAEPPVDLLGLYSVDDLLKLLALMKEMRQHLAGDGAAPGSS